MAGEQAVGRPAGTAPSGARSATAATFQVDDKSLRSLLKLFGDLTTQVGKFNTSLHALSQGTAEVDKLSQKMGDLQGQLGGSGGGGSSGSTTTRSSFSGQGGGGGGGEGQPGGAGKNGGSGGFLAAAKWIGGGALGVSAFSASYYNQRMPDMSSYDLMLNQNSQAFGNGVNRATYTRARQFLTGSGAGTGNTGIGGYQSTQDLLGGVGAVQSVFGGTIGNGGREDRVLREAGAFSALRPDAGLTGSGAVAANLYSAQTDRALRSITGMGSRNMGTPASRADIYNSLARASAGGKQLTTAQINAGMVQGMGLQQTAAGVGFSADTQEEMKRFLLAQANLGGDSKRAVQAMSDANNNKITDDVKRAGLLDSIRSRQNQVGGQATRNSAELMDASKTELQGSFSQLAKTTGELNELFMGLDRHVGGALTSVGGANAVLGGGQLAGILQTVGGVGGGIFAATGIRDLLNRRRGRGGSGGGGGGRSGAGLGGGGGEVVDVYVVNQCCDDAGGSGGGGGGGGKGRVSRAAKGAEEVEEEASLGRGARLAGAARRTAGRVGLPLAEGAATAVAMDTYGGAGHKASVAGGALVTGVSMVNPELGAGVGAALTFMSRGITQTISSGILPGLMSNQEITNKENSSNFLGGLVELQHKLNTEGWLQVPGLVQEYDRDIKPLVQKAKVGDDVSIGRAQHALAQFMGRWKQRKDAWNVSRGKTQSGGKFFGIEQQTNAGMNGFAGGGLVPGQHDRDDVNIRATPGEVVVPRSAVARHGGPGALMRKLGFFGRGAPGGHYAGGGQVIGDTEGLNPEFKRRLKAWSAAVGEPYKVGSGYRSIAEQVRLYNRWINHVPGQAKAAKPGSSNHNFGLASDGPHWRGKNPEKFGLRYPMSFEPWHVEPIGAKAMRGGAAGAMDLPDGAVSAAPEVGGGNVGAPVGATSPGLFGSEADAYKGLAPSLSGPSAIPAQRTLMGAGGPTDQTGAGTPMKAPTGNVAAWVQQALGILHLDFAKYGGAIATIIQHESGGNPRAVNNWDSNAKAGHPSKGIMQTIDGTFKAHALPGHGDIFNPVDNIIAATRYAIGRYGSMDNVPGIKSLNSGGPYKGYMAGTWRTGEGPAQLHHDEMVVPAGAARKIRSMISTGTASPDPLAASRMQVTTSGASTRPISVAISMPVQLLGAATEQDAKKLVKMMKAEMEQDHDLAMIGQG